MSSFLRGRLLLTAGSTAEEAARGGKLGGELSRVEAEGEARANRDGSRLSLCPDVSEQRQFSAA